MPGEPPGQAQQARRQPEANSAFIDLFRRTFGHTPHTTTGSTRRPKHQSKETGFGGVRWFSPTRRQEVDPVRWHYG